MHSGDRRGEAVGVVAELMGDGLVDDLERDLAVFEHPGDGDIRDFGAVVVFNRAEAILGISAKFNLDRVKLLDVGKKVVPKVI